MRSVERRSVAIECTKWVGHCFDRSFTGSKHSDVRSPVLWRDSRPTAAPPKAANAKRGTNDSILFEERSRVRRISEDCQRNGYMVENG